MSNKLTIEEARKVALEAIAKEKAMYEELNNEEERMNNNEVDGMLCFFRHTQGNNKGELVSVAIDIEKEEDRRQFVALFQRLLEYPEFVRAMEEKKNEHTNI